MKPERKYVILSRRENEDYCEVEYNNALLSAWLKKLPLVTGAQHIFPESLSSSDVICRDIRSLIIESHYIPLLDLPVDDSVRTIPKQLCLNTIVDTGDSDNLTLGLLKPALEYIEKSNHKVCGQIIGILLTRTHEAGEMHSYTEVIFPLEKLP